MMQNSHTGSSSSDGERLDPYRSSLQSMRSWCNEWFESQEAKVMFGTLLHLLVFHQMMLVVARQPTCLGTIMQDGGNNVVKGGFVNLPLALSKYLQSRGGEIITNTAVTKIIIREGKL